MYYDRQGKPMTMQEWSEAFRKPRHIGDTRVGDVRISTVWLGLDHGWGHGAPLIFETMVFGGKCDQDMERYSTEAEAIEGHARMVERVKENEGK